MAWNVSRSSRCDGCSSVVRGRAVVNVVVREVGGGGMCRFFVLIYLAVPSLSLKPGRPSRHSRRCRYHSASVGGGVSKEGASRWSRSPCSCPCRCCLRRGRDVRHPSPHADVVIAARCQSVMRCASDVHGVRYRGTISAFRWRRLCAENETVADQWSTDEASCWWKSCCITGSPWKCLRGWRHAAQLCLYVLVLRLGQLHLIKNISR